MIPDYQSLMLPLLKYIRDGKIHTTQDAIAIIAKQFKLNENDLNEWLPSKKQKTFHNRVYWAKAHLKMAGVIENFGRGEFKITNRGIKILKEDPAFINVKYLTNKFEEYKNLITGYRKKGNNKNTTPNEELETDDSDLNKTPEEQIELGYQKICISLQVEILSKLKSVHPTFFEKIVVELLVKMGYGGSVQDAGKAIGKSGDEGIDGIIKEDKLGLDIIYVQAKRWEGVVGRPELHKFVGALAGQGAKKGIFITTSSFTKEAKLYTPKNETKIVLIDGEKLSQYMIDYNLGVSVQNNYEIKKIDSDYFEEE